MSARHADAGRSRVHRSRAANVAPTWQAAPMQLGDDRTRPDGRQHGPAADRRRPRLRRPRRRPRSRSRRSRRRAPRGARTLEELVAGHATRRGTCGSWCRPRSSARPSTAWRRCSTPATRSSTAATRWYRDDVDRSEPLLRRARHPLPRRRHERRHPRARARLLLDGRRRRRRGRPAWRRSSTRWRPGVDAAERTPGRSGEPDAGRAAAGCTAGRAAPGTS